MQTTNPYNMVCNNAFKLQALQSVWNEILSAFSRILVFSQPMPRRHLILIFGFAVAAMLGSTPFSPATPFSPPSGLAHRLFRSLPQKANS